VSQPLPVGIWWLPTPWFSLVVNAMNVPLFHVDAFTGKPFSGNPAAVCVLPS
jgi:hypothetical protein